MCPSVYARCGLPKTNHVCEYYEDTSMSSTGTQVRACVSVMAAAAFWILHPSHLHRHCLLLSLALSFFFHHHFLPLYPSLSDGRPTGRCCRRSVVQKPQHQGTRTRAGRGSGVGVRHHRYEDHAGRGTADFLLIHTHPLTRTTTSTHYQSNTLTSTNIRPPVSFLVCVFVITLLS